MLDVMSMSRGPGSAPRKKFASDNEGGGEKEKKLFCGPRKVVDSSIGGEKSITHLKGQRLKTKRFRRVKRKGKGSNETLRVGKENSEMKSS